MLRAKAFRGESGVSGPGTEVANSLDALAAGRPILQVGQLIVVRCTRSSTGGGSRCFGGVGRLVQETVNLHLFRPGWGCRQIDMDGFRHCVPCPCLAPCAVLGLRSQSPPILLRTGFFARDHAGLSSFCSRRFLSAECSLHIC